MWLFVQNRTERERQRHVFSALHFIVQHANVKFFQRCILSYLYLNLPSTAPPHPPQPTLQVRWGGGEVSVSLPQPDSDWIGLDWIGLD